MFTFLSVLLKLYIVLKIHLFPFMQNYGIFTEVLQYKKKMFTGSILKSSYSVVAQENKLRWIKVPTAPLLRPKNMCLINAEISIHPNCSMKFL